MQAQRLEPTFSISAPGGTVTFDSPSPCFGGVVRKNSSGCRSPLDTFETKSPASSTLRPKRIGVSHINRPFTHIIKIEFYTQREFGKSEE